MAALNKKPAGVYNLIVGNFVLFLLVSSLIVLLALLSKLNSTIDQLSKDRLEEMLTLTQEELNAFFYPINNEIQLGLERARQGLFKSFELSTFNEYFYPLLKNSKQISSIIIATSDGEEYMALNQDTTFINRLTTTSSDNKPASRRIIWKKEQTGRLTKVDEYQQDERYDPRSRPWYLKGKATPPQTITWTDPYIFYTTKQAGITSVIRWNPDSSGRQVFMAFDILLQDISRFTTQLHLSERSKIIVLTKDNKVIGLPNDQRFNNADSIHEYLLKAPSELEMPLINESVKRLAKIPPDQNYVSFYWHNQFYWTGSRKYPLGNDNWLYIGAVVPESDFFIEIRKTRMLIWGGFGLILLFIILMATSYFQKRRDNRTIHAEKEKNEQLLLNTLPAKVVHDLLDRGKSEPERFSNVTVMFIDIVDFTRHTASMDPKALIDELNEIYTVFDEITEKHNCERIKTIGDAYMAVSGMPHPDKNNAENMLLAAFEIRQYISERNTTNSRMWEVRIGLHSGKVVGGIIGIKKYIYDVFGDTINTASRMQACSEPMKINISESTKQLLEKGRLAFDGKIRFTDRPPQEVKGKGLMHMYYAEPA